MDKVEAKSIIKDDMVKIIKDVYNEHGYIDEWVETEMFRSLIDYLGVDIHECL